MLIRRFKPVFMAAKDDGEDGGGGEATTIIDGAEDTVTAGDRGDDLQQPLDAAALKKVAGTDTVEGGEGNDTVVDGDEAGGKRGSSHVPIGRFNEVNEKAKRLEREVSELKQKAAAPPATPQPTQPPKPEFDEDKAEKEYATLLAEGEFDKAVAKRKEINAHIRDQARDQAEASVRSSIEQRETVTSVTKVAEQAVKDWPYLDTAEGAETMELIIAARDGFAAKGMPMAQALQAAVDKIAPKYAPAQQATPGKDSTGKTTSEDTRSQQATARGAEASTRQPPKLDGGAGNRATQDKVAVEDLDDDQFDALPEAEKRRLRGDAG